MGGWEGSTASSAPGVGGVASSSASLASIRPNRSARLVWPASWSIWCCRRATKSLSWPASSSRRRTAAYCSARSSRIWLISITCRSRSVSRRSTSSAAPAGKHKEKKTAVTRTHRQGILTSLDKALDSSCLQTRSLDATWSAHRGWRTERHSAHQAGKPTHLPTIRQSKSGMALIAAWFQRLGPGSGPDPFGRRKGLLNYELSPAVLGPGRFVVPRVQGPLLTVGDGLHPAG